MPKADHAAFFPLLGVVFLIWLVYRNLLVFPIWFDETIGKAIFFGLPVWLYISVSGERGIVKTLSLSQFMPGVLRGLALGGLFGFAATIASVLGRDVIIQPAPLFSSLNFWKEFFLSIMTGFWETLFFFSFVMTVVLQKFKNWSLLQQLGLVTLVFILFHIPNTIIRFAPSAIVSQLIVLSLFALGQGLIFVRWRNIYTLSLVHAIWGLVLLIHLG